MAHGLLFEDGKLRYGEGELFSSEAFLTEYAECISRLSGAYKEFSGSPKETESVVGGAFYGTGVMVSVCLCRTVCEILAENGIPIPLSEFFGDMTEPENSKIAYIRNSYSDMAYRAFSETLGQASVLYPDSFSSVCEEVYYGRAGYCILPYETSDDGSLSGFLKLIHKYELAPIMTVGIVTDPDPEVGKMTFFALLAKNVKRISGELALKGIKSTEYLKINIDDSKGNTVAEVSMAALACGLLHVKTESLPILWDRGRYMLSLTFKVNGADILPFLTWLKLSMPECSPESLYSLLS